MKFAFFASIRTRINVNIREYLVLWTPQETQPSCKSSEEKEIKIFIANFEKPLPSPQWRNTLSRLGEPCCDTGKIKVSWDMII